MIETHRARLADPRVRSPTLFLARGTSHEGQEVVAMHTQRIVDEALGAGREICLRAARG